MTNPLNAAPGKTLTPAAQRALEETAERRSAERADVKADTQKPEPAPTETNGPSGAEPTRFGDWERGGIAYDF